MKRILTSLFLAMAIVLSPFGPAARAQQLDQTAKVKAEVVRRLTKKEEHVKIKLRNGSELKGRITQTTENGFTLSQDKTHASTEIAYADVLKVEGRGMSKKKKILIASAIGLGILVILVVIEVRNFDPFKGGLRLPL